MGLCEVKIDGQKEVGKRREGGREREREREGERERLSRKGKCKSGLKYVKARYSEIRKEIAIRGINQQDKGLEDLLEKMYTRNGHLKVKQKGDKRKRLGGGGGEGVFDIAMNL